MVAEDVQQKEVDVIKKKEKMTAKSQEEGADLSRMSVEDFWPSARSSDEEMEIAMVSMMPA